MKNPVILSANSIYSSTRDSLKASIRNQLMSDVYLGICNPFVAITEVLVTLPPAAEYSYVQAKTLCSNLFCRCYADDLMADQRMDISSTMTDFMSPSSTDLISSSISTPGMDYNRKRKGSTSDYQ